MATRNTVQLVQELEGKHLYDDLYALGMECIDGAVKTNELKLKSMLLTLNIFRI